MSANLRFEVDVVSRSSRNLDDINVGPFCDICSPVDRRAHEGDALSDILHDFKFGYLPVFENVAFLPATKPGIDNALFVVMELFESSQYSVTLITVDGRRLYEIVEVQQHVDCSNDVRWCGSCNHRDYILLYITLSLPCDLFQISDAGGETPVVHDGLEN